MYSASSAFLFPYVGIIQIRLWVKAIQLTLSLLLQAPLVIYDPIIVDFYCLVKFGTRESAKNLTFRKL